MEQTVVEQASGQFEFSHELSEGITIFFSLKIQTLSLSEQIAAKREIMKIKSQSNIGLQSLKKAKQQKVAKVDRNKSAADAMRISKMSQIKSDNRSIDGVSLF